MQIKVVTYNIHKGLAPGNRRSVVGRMREALDALAPDIVLLQEVVDLHERFAARVPGWPAEPQAQFIAHGLRHKSAYGRNAVHAHGGHGNAVLSHFEFSHHRNVVITVNRWEHRGMLHVVVEVPGGPPIHVACVHLNLLHRDRVRQLGLMCSFINSEVPPGEPLIIGGDFNDWRGKATRLLADRLGVDEVAYTNGLRHAPTFPAWRPVLPLDRIYTRNLAIDHARVMSGQPWQQLSDHLPVVAVLSVGTSPGPDDVT